MVGNRAATTSHLLRSNHTWNQIGMYVYRNGAIGLTGITAATTPTGTTKVTAPGKAKHLWEKGCKGERKEGKKGSNLFERKWKWHNRGSRGVFSPGPHTTRHVGPHRAVHNPAPGELSHWPEDDG